MRIHNKNDASFAAVKYISDSCFSGPEKPNENALRFSYDLGEVFVEHADLRTDGLVVTTGIAIATHCSSTDPYLLSLAVLPKFRGQGIGGRLIEEVASHFREKCFDTVTLSVKVDNPAQKLYFDHGFRVIRVVPRRYGEVSGLIMRRNLCH